MNKLSILVVISLACVASVRSQAQLATLYESPGCVGASTAISGTYIPDLSTRGFDNRARSARLVGIWLFYLNKNYNLAGNAGMEYAYEAFSTCVNLQSLGGYVSSIRYAGAPNEYRADTISLYENTFFQGVEEYSAGDLPNLSLHGRIKSLVITGNPNLGWTLYDRPNYDGNAVCVFPPPGEFYEPAIISNTNDISVPHGTIASIRKGCFGTRTAVYKNAPLGVHVV